MSEEANKSIVHEYIDTWNRGDIDGLADYWSPDIIHHTRSLRQNADDVKNVLSDFMSAFPDLHFKIDDIVVQGDRVATRMTASGTHTGAYMGVPATGKNINCTVMGIVRLQDGKIVEHWGVTDELAMLAQLGLLPQAYLAGMT